MSYPKLRGKIREKYGTQEAFAKAMSMSPGTMSLKLTGKSEWTRPEMEEACNLLDIPLIQAFEYFTPVN